MKAKFFKRVIAYIIDIIIVTVISSFITVFVPLGNSQNISNELIETMTDYQEKEITEREYLEKSEVINYKLTKETTLITLINAGIYIIYFVIVPLYNKKQTFGKRVMKIKIKNINGKKITANDLMYRSLIIYGILVNIVNVILVLFLDKSLFIVLNRYLGYLNSITLVVIILLSIIRKDGRGLHDLIGKTIVVEEE